MNQAERVPDGAWCLWYWEKYLVEARCVVDYWVTTATPALLVAAGGWC